MNKKEEDILKLGFDAGKKAIDMHPDDDSYDFVRMKEARVLVEKLTIAIVSKSAICSGCNRPKPTVNRYAFDGMCADCVTMSLYDYNFTEKAKKRNEELK
jgi:hypothetical protein